MVGLPLLKQKVVGSKRELAPMTFSVSMAKFNSQFTISFSVNETIAMKPAHIYNAI